MIRKRTESDIDQIMQVWLLASSLAHPFLAGDFVEKATRDLKEVYIPNTETWVYEEKDTVIGFISMLDHEIGGLFVLPSKQNLGIGTQLVNLTQELYGALEVEVFEKNVIGRTFYEKCGFKHSDRYFHDKSDQFILRLRCDVPHQLRVN